MATSTMTQSSANLSVEIESSNEIWTDAKVNYESSCSTTNLTVRDNGTDLEIPLNTDIDHLAITGFSLLMICSAVGNTYVLISIMRKNTNRKFSRIDLLLLHLTIADLLVTFFFMPVNIVYNYTLFWHAGDLICRLVSFLIIFGHYLIGFVLVVISLDLYFVVTKPLGISYADKRAKILLAAAWITSIICSSPQPILFHVEKYDCYDICTTLNTFPFKVFEIAYVASGLFFLHDFPLSMIIFCYSCILYQIFKANKKKSTDNTLRRSSTAGYDRAKVRVMKMSAAIVATFFLCWAPYTIMKLWYWIDSKSAQIVNQSIEKIVLVFVCANPVLNPVIYSFFQLRRKPKSQNAPVSRTGEGNSGVEFSDVSFSRTSDTHTGESLTNI